MKVLGVFQFIEIISAALVVISVHGQTINSPCTASMISSFTPCLNFITGSSSNGSSTPTTACCGAFKSMMNGGKDCLCLVVTANVPLPINRTLAISLPRACNMESIPLKCQASGSPLPAPGPVLLAPSFPPPAASPDESPLSPQASEVSATAPAPQSETSTQLTPPVSPPPIGDDDDDEPETPTTTSATPGIRPVLTPKSSSASTTLSYISPISFLLQITSTIGFLVLIF